MSTSNWENPICQWDKTLVTQKRFYEIILQMSDILRTRIKELMQKEGLSQKALSLKASLNETAIRDILKDRVKNPRADTLKAIASVLNVSVEYLIEEQTSSHYPSTPLGDLVYSKAIISNQHMQPSTYIEKKQEEVVGLKPAKYKNKNVFAATVEDHSVNQIYPKGSRLFCVPLEEWARPLKSKQRVLVWSSLNDGQGKLRVFELGTQGENGDVPLYAKSTDNLMTSEMITSRKGSSEGHLKERAKKWKEEPSLETAEISYTPTEHDPHKIVAVVIAHTVEE